LEAPLNQPKRATGYSSPSKVGGRSVSEEKSSSHLATLSSASVVPVRSSRDPRRKKHSISRQSNGKGNDDETKLGKSCSRSKVVYKMSFVEYQAREALGKDKSECKALPEDKAVASSLAEHVLPIGEVKICHGGSKSKEIILEEAATPKNVNVVEENFENVNDCEIKAKLLLEELTQLSTEMEEEKEKSKRLYLENESLDIELEKIREKLKRNI
jgi:hypothetical protein